MLKFFYRLKRRNGVVLFAVIAVMTLLIAMASTAYLTARSSYQSVVSNYDFSQLYLSTTSVADMVIGALTQSTSRSDVKGSDGKPLNDYSGIKQAVIDLKNTATKGKYIEGYSEALYSVKDGSVNDQLQAAAADPIEPGIIDAVKIKISLDDIQPQKASDGSLTGMNYYYFTVTTTGFYRNNVVSVQDGIYNLSGTTTKPSKTPSFDTFFKNTGGSSADDKGERAVIIATQEISDNAYFENTYTIFTEISGGNNVFKGGITATGSVFFKGQAQFDIPAPGKVWDRSGSQTSMANARHDWFINGDLGLFADNTQNLNLNGNNLYVNGDLIIGNQQGISAHNVYVSGNIYVMNDGVSITIQNESGGSDKNAGAVFCGGNIYYFKDYTDAGKTSGAMPLKNDDGSANSAFVSKYGGSWTTLQDEYDFIQSKVSAAINEVGGSDGGKAWKAGGDIGIKDRLNDSNLTLYVGGLANGGSVSKYIPLSDKGDYDPASTTVNYSTLTASGNDYVYSAQSGSIKDLFDTDSGITKPNDWTSYTAKDNTMKNLLSIELDGDVLDGNSDAGWAFELDPKGNIIGPAEMDFTTSSGQIVHATKESGGDAVYYFYSASDASKTNPTTVKWDSATNSTIIDIAFDKNGYVLDLPSTDKFKSWSNGGNNSITYNIHTSEKIETADNGYKGTMPIVLMANFNDGAPGATDKDGNNAFSWTGGTPSSGANGSSAITFVNVVNEDGTASAGTVSGGKASAGGNVIFEMGNIDSSGNYVVFSKSSSLDAVTYHAGSHDLVGTLNQTTKLAEGGKDDYNGKDGKVKDLYKSSGNGSDVDPQYENRIMIISSKDTKGVGSGRFAYKSDSDIEMLCGYIYAPDGLYGNGYGNQKVPIFGGLIVSEMVSAMASYMYAEPDPTIVAQMLEGLTPTGGGSKTGGTEEGTWYLYGANIGKNYLG